jgi:hypothetical protein
MDWEESELPRGIVGLLGESRTLAELAEALGVTEARVLWYLNKLSDAGRVVEDGGRWRRTDLGVVLAETARPETARPETARSESARSESARLATARPESGRGGAGPERGEWTVSVSSAQDYVQAYADAAAGMFGSGFTQDSGEHAGRVPEERVAEFRERLVSLVGEYFAPDKVDRDASPKYGFRWVLTPVDLHPLDG